MFCIKAKKCLKFLKLEESQCFHGNSGSKVNKRYCLENTNLKTDYSPQRYHKASLFVRKLLVC